jgi:hypothetical protein
MRKVFNNKFIAGVALLGVLASCNKEDDSLMDLRKSKPVVTVDQISYTVAEGDVITVTLNLDKAFKEKSDLKLDIIGGTASFRDMFSDTDGNEATDEETTVDDGWGQIGYKIAVPAYATTYSFDISFPQDLLAEGTETLKLRLSSAGNSNSLVADDSKEINVTIADYMSDDLVTELDWSGSFTNAHGNIVLPTYTDNTANKVKHEFTGYDFDLYILDSGGSPINFDGATGDHPEVVVLDAGAPDDDYYVLVDFWDDAGYTPAERFEFDMRLRAAKPGTWFYQYQIDDTFFSDSPVSASGDGTQLVAMINKTGTVYTFQTMDGDVLAQGRAAAAKFKNFKRARK